MKTLVIHPIDVTTGFLEEIYQGKDYTVIDHNIGKKELKTAIKEHDRIIMLGHGDGMGLFGYDRYIIDSTLVYLLREKICICIWCYAQDFVERYNLNGFYTGMFISDGMEAIIECVDATDHEINESNQLFAKVIGESLDSENIITDIILNYNVDSDVAKYNRSRLFLNKNVI